MARSTELSLVAVDIGNSRIKLGEFALPLAEPLAQPRHVARIPLDWDEKQFAAALPGDMGEHAWAIASVNRPAAARLLEWLEQRGVDRLRLLTHADMPITIDMARPERVGIDRLADVVAASRLCGPDETAIVVDHGSAITVNLVSGGTFLGGAIMPGTTMAARALNEFTDGLPLVSVTDVPQMLERSTEGAIQFGLTWGAVGAVRELVARLSSGSSAPRVFVTGGGGGALAALLAQDDRPAPQFIPHLTLAGAAVAGAAYFAQRPS
jgi:type III pantothenate kinase